MENIEFNLDNNIFIRMSEINNLRRELIEKLIIKRTSNDKEIVINNYKINYLPKKT